jgi:hypothetical protein
MREGLTRHARLLTVGIAVTGGYAALIGWFWWADVYNAHFFDRGGLLALYNVLRIVFAAVIAWVIYAPGMGLLALVAGSAAMRSLRPGERYALGFFAGAGLWHVVLFGIGFAGGYTKPVALGMTLAAIALSTPHLMTCVGEARRLLPASFGRGNPKAARNIRYLAIFAIVAALFICIKVLYANGGNDYYSHYFYYYVDVIRNGSLMPNEVWYHFYYSKGCGLYFLAMLLSDPLAPQLVTASFVFAGALTAALILNRVAPGTSAGWIGGIVYIALLIFTPSPPDLVGAAGWAELAKTHEVTGALFFGVFWIGTRLVEGRAAEHGIWLTAAIGAVAAMVLVTIEMAFVAGAFLAALALWGLATRRFDVVWAALLCATVAGVLLIGIAALNYALTGIPIDQLMLYLWPIIDLEQVARWGLLNEVLWTHHGMTGFLHETAPLGPGALYQLYRYLRLDLWWPIAAFGVGGASYAIAVGRWRGGFGLPGRRAFLVSVVAFLAIFTLIAAVLGAGQMQGLSFYRFSSFAYGPTLCAALLLCAAFPYSSRGKAVLAGTLIAALVASGETGKHGRMMLAGMPMLTGDAVSFAAGGMSLENAYQHPGWPARYPWGGIYPAMEEVWKIVGRGAAVYSLNLQSYCMLPDCRVLTWDNTRTVPDFQTVLFGTPDEGMAAIKRAGIDYFFYSTELAELPSGIATPIVLSPIFAPDAIAQYFVIKWSDGTSYLLTWADRSERPLDPSFLAAYRRQIKDSPIAASFPLAAWRSVFDHFRTYGVHPYRLPWCVVCPGAPDN